MAKAAEAAYEAIRAGIVSGDFARGQRLREEELASLVGVLSNSCPRGPAPVGR